MRAATSCQGPRGARVYIKAKDKGRTSLENAFRGAALIETRSRTHCVEIAGARRRSLFHEVEKEKIVIVLWNRLLFDRARARGNVSFKIPHLVLSEMQIRYLGSI
jgi:hypothetical protein